MKKVFIEMNKFALPLLAGNIMQLMIAQIALSFAGQLAYENIPAITTMSNFLFSITGILGVIALAFNMISSKALGEKNTKKFNDLVSSIFILSTIIGLLTLLLILVGSNFLLQSVYRFDGELLQVAQGYLYSVSPYVLLTLLSFSLTNLIKVEKKTNYIFSVSIISSIIQAVLSYLLIKGPLFFPEMGAIGAGLAEMIALFVSVTLYAFLVRKLLLTSLRSKPTEIKNILTRSVPLIFQEILEGVLFIIIFEALISRIGVMALTTYSLMMQGINYAKLPTFMYSNSLFVFVSEAYGEKNKKKVTQNMFSALGLSAFFYIIIGMTLIIWNKSFSSLFTSDTLVVDNLNHYIILGVLTIFSTVFYENIKATLLSLEKEKIVLAMTAAINGIAIIGLISLSLLGKLTFPMALSIYGLNYFLLALIFAIILFKQKDFDEAQIQCIDQK